MRALTTVCVASFCLSACQADATPPPPPPPCDEECTDGIAILAVREAAKLAFNVMLQGKPVGDHDETKPCPFGGTARVFGNATSNATQGATEVRLTYVFAGCAGLSKDDEAKENYELRLTGTLTQEGILAVQPSATSALIMKSDTMKIEGTVYDPPKDYNADCPLELGQNGNALTGKICGRETKTQL